MTKRSVTALLLSALLLLLVSGCRDSSGDDKARVKVYYTPAGTVPFGESMLQAEEIEIDDSADIVGETLARLFAQPESAALRSPFPAGSSVLSYSVHNGNLLLNLSHEYNALTGIDAVIADYAVTLTLCSLDDIYSVVIHADMGRTTNALTVDDIMHSESDVNPYEKRILLYFPDTVGRFVVPEYHNITIGQDSLLVRFVAEELIGGPLQPSLKPALPAGTRLLSVSLNGGTTCTVDFSQEFLTNKPLNAADERMTIYSIVNSLTALSGVESVQILVEGQRVSQYLYISLSEPLKRFEGAIGPVDSALGEKDITLYVVSPGGNQLIALPTAIVKDEYQTIEFAAVDRLLTLEPCKAYVNPFPQGTKLLSAVRYNNICRVNLSGEFNNIKSAELKAMACKSIAASLLPLGDISEIQIYVNGVKDMSVSGSLVSSIYTDPNLFLK